MSTDPRRANRPRLLAALVAVLALVAVFTFRLVDVQVVQAAGLNAASKGQRANLTTLYGTRGEIVDSGGTVLATSVDRWNVTVDPSLWLKYGVTDALNAKLARIAAVLKVDAASLLTTMQTSKQRNNATLASQIDLLTLTALKQLDIAGLYYQLQPKRIYPNGAIAGSVVGFTNDSGGGGVEQKYNACLASTDGAATSIVSPNGVRLPGTSVTTKAPVDGGTLKLTVDSDLQWFTQNTLAQQVAAAGAQWGTALVVRVSDGHVMAVADAPTYDPNDLNSAPKTPDGGLDLQAGAFTRTYEPGSTIKAITAAMLIDSGTVTGPEARTTAPGWFYTGYKNHRFTDAEAHGDEPLTLAGVIAQSSNTGISTFVKNMPASKRADYLKAFGLTGDTAVDFPGESGGILKPYKEWDDQSTYQIMFGQGIATTSAQVASAYQALADKGVHMPLTLVEGCTKSDGTVIDAPSTQGTRVVSEKAADDTVSMLEQVVSSGTLEGSVTVPGYRVAAKTGTAQVAKTDGSGYSDDRVISVAGVAPAEDPQYVVVVTIGLPTTIRTGAAAGPAFSSIMSQTLTTFRVPPSTTDAPKLPLRW